MLYRLRDQTRECIERCDTERSFPIRFIEEISSAPSRQELLSIVARWLPRFFPADRASLTLKHDENNLCVVAFEGDDAIPVALPLPIEHTSTGQACSRKEIWLTSDTRHDDATKIDLQLLSSKGLLSCVSIPLIMSGKCFGCLNLAHSKVGTYDNADIPMLRAFAFWIASQLNHHENARLISEARQRERDNLTKLDELARLDSLTGLLNRREFTLELSARLAGAPANAEIGLLYVDLDGFKEVNDTFGHSSGDVLLKQTAQRIIENLRPGDLAARLGGDEFAIAIGPLPSRGVEIVETVGNRLVEAIKSPYELADHVTFVSASIGIRVARAGETDCFTIMREADLALYQVKRHGGSNIKFFDEEFGENVRQSMLLANDLRVAIERCELQLRYQPIVDARSHRIVSCEALARWHHPHHGFVPPDKFIAMAETTTFISKLGEWVLRTACQEATRWPSDISVSVNMSPRQFALGGVERLVANALHESLLDPQRLHIEITESALLDESEETALTLARLGEMGVSIVLDDFGVGYASFNYLKQHRFSKLKIDKSLIFSMNKDDSTTPIIRAILDLSSALSVRTTAEGVETADHRDLLYEMGCDELQGFLFSKPLPPDDIREFIELQRHAPVPGTQCSPDKGLLTVGGLNTV